MFSINETVTEEKARNMNTIVLAFIGDAVYSLYIREKLAFHSDDKVAILHKLAADEVRASSQADYIDKIFDSLLDCEKDVYRRARNTRKTTKAKSATVTEYNKSTGFEALLGYLYITGQKERLDFLLNTGETD